MFPFTGQRPMLDKLLNTQYEIRPADQTQARATSIQTDGLLKAIFPHSDIHKNIVIDFSAS